MLRASETCNFGGISSLWWLVWRERDSSRKLTFILKRWWWSNKGRKIRLWSQPFIQPQWKSAPSILCRQPTSRKAKRRRFLIWSKTSSRKISEKSDFKESIIHRFYQVLLTNIFPTYPVNFMQYSTNMNRRTIDQILWFVLLTKWFPIIIWLINEGRSRPELKLTLRYTEIHGSHSLL